jgi:protein-tyrosine phosphatase
MGGVPCYWGAASFLAVAAAYGRLGPGLFGKRRDGRMTPARVALLLPFLACAWGLWALQRALGRSTVCSRVAPGLWLGRRPLPRELPPDVSLVADLTCEFPAPRGVCKGRAYRCLPTLDATAPELEAFAALAREVAAWPGEAYVHCAVGHGRSAVLMMAVLMERGLAADAAEAERLVRMARPRVRLTSDQRALLARYEHLSGSARASSPPERGVRSGEAFDRQ